MRILATAGTLSIFLLLIGCDKAKPADKTTTSTQTATAPTTRDVKFASYFFAMEHEKLGKFVADVNGLNFGTHVSDIKTLLGEPDSEGDGHKISFVHVQHHVYSLTYVIARYREGLVTEGKDEMVHLYFDDKDQLESVLSECPNISTRGQ